MFGVTKSDDAATESGKLMNSFRDIQKSIFSDLGLHFRFSLRLQFSFND